MKKVELILAYVFIGGIMFYPIILTVAICLVGLIWGPEGVKALGKWIN